LLDIPVGNILGHREVFPRKTCPGLKFDMDLFRADVHTLME